MQFVMKTRQYNDVTHCTSVVYAENETQLLWLIESNGVFDENQTGKWRDELYRCGLHQN